MIVFIFGQDVFLCELCMSRQVFKNLPCLKRSMEITKKQFNYLTWLTLVGFSALGFALIYFFQKKEPLSIFENGQPWYLQIFMGGVFGWLIGEVAKQIIKTKWMADISIFFADIVRELQLSTTEILFYSLCAGVGEEVLFRGAIQEWLGIWLTSIVFIALHGYLNPMNWKITVYGFFMIFLSAGLGYLYLYAGIISAMTAHFAVDVVLFLFLKNRLPNPEN